MNKPIHDNQINKVLLKPRFKMEFDENKENILNKFKNKLKDTDCKYDSTIVDYHVIIDVPIEDEHFWSPQMHVEIEKENNKTIVRGVLGPKPIVWTFFMFLHFAVAITFFVFFVIFYSKWSLKQDYTFAMIMCFVMPIVWVLLYFVGQLGKKIGYTQMVELHDFLVMTVQSKS
ncbi:MAG: GTP-binding protein [Flavobacteriaceae bacterium]|nr:GTP-binding protein [Flavobacteriaceae bacterium]